MLNFATAPRRIRKATVADIERVRTDPAAAKLVTDTHRALRKFMVLCGVARCARCGGHGHLLDDGDLHEVPCPNCQGVGLSA
jgi:hypothetical protein